MGVFTSKYEIKKIVYLITDLEQNARMITAVCFTADNGVVYSLAQGTTETKHYECEISHQKNIDIVLGINNN